MVMKHMDKDTIDIDNKKLEDLYKSAKELLDKIGFKLWWQEKQVILEKLESKSIPFPKLQVKDHKPKKGGKFQTRLLVSADINHSNYQK